MPQTSLIMARSFRRFLFNPTILLCLFLSLPAVPLNATGWHTSGVQIDNPSGAPFVITGINWYGFETTSSVAHGLYHEDYTFILNEVKQYGYSTIRIPFSNQMWESDPIPNSNTISACPSCKGTH